MDQRKIHVQQNELGEWAARWEDGLPNDIQVAGTEQEARDKLLKHSVESRVLPKETGPRTVAPAVAGEPNRIIVRPLPNPTKMGPKINTHVAYRENKPEVQAYGENETAAKVQFLANEQHPKK